jgi:hypothetical protein
MSTCDPSVYRAIVASSNSANGQIFVRIPSLLGIESTIELSKIGRSAHDGVWTVPAVGTQIVVTADDPNFTNAFWVQTDQGALQGQLNTKAPLVSPSFTGTVSGITKTMVGLGSVDNTSNATERAATATLTNKTLTSPVINTPTGIVKGDVGLGNVDNTADTAKPISTAQQTALNLKANIASPSFTGNASFAGAVTATGAPSVSATRGSDYTYNNYTQNVPIVFNVTSHNVGNHYNTSTGLLTAPIAGDYFVSAGVYSSSGADINQLWTIINGARGVSFVLSGNDGSSNMSGSGIVRLNVGDTFGVAAWFGGGSYVINANGFHTFLRIRYIG